MAGWVSITLGAVTCIVVGAALCAIWWWMPKFQIRGLTMRLWFRHPIQRLAGNNIGLAPVGFSP
jgi:hypothetical protein